MAERPNPQKGSPGTGERTRSIVAITVSVAALLVVVIGLVSTPSAPATLDQRVDSLAASIKCPFCNGESLAESASGVAADYRALIAERIESGATDEEIRSEFAANFGEAFILDSSGSPWSIALWVLPIAVLIAGVVTILSLRRSGATSGQDERSPTTIAEQEVGRT